MKLFNRILFPVDFSDMSPKIVPWVLAMGKSLDSEVHMLFVARRLEYFSAVNIEYVCIKNFQNEIVRGAELKMEEFKSKHFNEHIPCKTKVVLGDAAEEILKYVESARIDLVIMGTHGRKRLEKLFFGSVADKVIKTSNVPVLSINPHRVASVKGTE
ncbi:MAG: universal stress protein [Thermodesulfobacteriota bacterium]|nr:universal stress protein [Thermodesulfobacteriota bacterium]